MDAGYDYVGGVRRTREDAWWRRTASHAMNGLREKHHPYQDDRPGLHAARVQPRYRRTPSRQAAKSASYIPALAYTFANNPTEIDVGHEERAAGESKYSLYKLIRLNFDLVTGFSLVPLQMFSMFGMLVSPAHCHVLDRIVVVMLSGCSRGLAGIFSRRCRSLVGSRHPAFLPDRDVLFGLGSDRRVRRPDLPAGARALHDSACYTIQRVASGRHLLRADQRRSAPGD